MRFDWLSGWRRGWKVRSQRSSRRQWAIAFTSQCEALESRIVLTMTEGLDSTVIETNVVVDQYSAAAQEQYAAPGQEELQAALMSFIADTAMATSTVGVEQSSSVGYLGVFNESLATTSANTSTATTSSPEVLEGSQASGDQVTSVVGSTVGTSSDTSTGTSSSTSLFDSSANLSEFAGTVASSTFGTFAGTSTVTSGTSGGMGSTTGTSGSGTSVGGSGTSTGSSGTATGGTTGSGGMSGTTGDSSSGSSSDGDTSSGEEEEEDADDGWKPFVLPEGVAFDEVLLPAEEFAENLRLLEPTGQDSFTHTTVTHQTTTGDSGTSTITTTLTVTISQTYIDADHWMVSQSWTKEYSISGSSGDAEAGSGVWSRSSRRGVTTFSITVSLGFGVPNRPSVGPQPDPESVTDGDGSDGSDDGSDGANSGSAGSSSVSDGSTTSGSSDGSTGGSSSNLLGQGNFNSVSVTVTPVGPVSTISFSTSDTLSMSVGGSHDDSDAATGKVDTGNFAGSSNASASQSAALTEFDFLRADGTLAHTIQLTSASDRSASMQFKGGNDLFEAEGTVLDGNGNPTNGTTNPSGAPFNSPGAQPPTDPAPFLDGTEPPTPLGGDGSRVEAGSGLSVSSRFSTGSYFIADATTDAGTEFQEADITGTAGMHTDYDSSISVNDSLSLDSQSSDTTSGEFDYFSIGWKQTAAASKGFRFSYDMDLGDADLPDTSTASTPATPSGMPAGTVGSSTSTAGSLSTSAPSSDTSPDTTSQVGAAGSTAPSGTDGGSSGASSDGSSSSGGSSLTSQVPAVGAPVLKLSSNSSSSDNHRAWIQMRGNNSESTPSNTPGGADFIVTEQPVLSVRTGGGTSMSTSMTLVNGEPAVVVSATGTTSITFISGLVRIVDRDIPSEAPPGYAVTFCDKQDQFTTLFTTTYAINYTLSLTLAKDADPAMTGTTTFSVSESETNKAQHFELEIFTNIANPAQSYGRRFLYQGFHQTTTTRSGGVGGLNPNAMTTTTSGVGYTYLELDTIGTPPPPPPPTGDSITTALDYLQTGLDVAGLFPVIGEGADLLNAGISLGRGNYADAALSLAAMIPFAGVGATMGKFGNKIGKALGKNADKLDNVTDAVTDVCKKNCFVAGTQVVVNVVHDRTPTKATVETEASIRNESDAVSTNPVVEIQPTPIVDELAVQKQSFSTFLAGAGLALAVIRHIWTSSPPLQRSRRLRRQRTPQSAS